MQENLSQNELFMKAGSATTPPEVLRMLARDKDPRVRGAVARNPATLLSTLARLGYDAEEDVRLAVAGNPRTMSSTLILLSEDRVVRVRLASAAALSRRSPVRGTTPPAEGLPLNGHGSAIAAPRARAAKDPKPGMVLRYDPAQGKVIAVSVRMKEDVRRYVTTNWVAGRPEEEGPGGERGLGT